ncbi:hypothetical protein V7S76_13315, partial [Aquirufa sp. ROCK2-A2]
PWCPAYWESAPKKAVIQSGLVINTDFFSNSYLVPLGMHSTLPAPLPGIAGDSISYCVGAASAPLQAEAVSGATLNWYSDATGG